MIFRRINRSGAERVFLTVYNSYSTASLTDGQVVMWDYATDADGVSVTIPSARAVSAGVAAAGVVAETIASGSYGLLQIYGYHSAVRVRTATGGSPAIAAGRPLAVAAAGSVFCAESFATGSTSVLVFPLGFALEAQASWTTKTIAAFVKAM